MLAFINEVESEFYPDIGKLYSYRIRSWGAEHHVAPPTC